ncbi:hypothetical protein H7K45_18240 [Mycobacterium yunnanensis]|uniref:PASTA domain-containing protein n=1 Tax=Mycobacterium yunnanensis TaxID=368477 RepID=A0A9X2Z4K8_9MYCO|nr:hypothetical protein [Mycobacterium yunnanensis]MCV7422490.1 hypothetical protein [Mycobacterium yunnanensis]
MSGALRHTAWLAFAGAVLLGPAPIAGADQSTLSGQPADAAVAELQDQGYTVQINWVNGFDTKPLSECRVTGVDDPSSAPPSPGTFTTVYVDVACPNHDGGGFGFEAGIG